MRAFVTGGAGTLGSALLQRRPSDTTVTATWHRIPLGVPDVSAVQVDLAVDDLAAVVGRIEPDVVIHTAYAKEDLDRDVVTATARIAAAAAAVGARLIHLSTDAVFSGEQAPYGELDRPAPIHAYGRAKLRAERAVVDASSGAAIVRTSLLVDPTLPDPSTGFILRALQERQPVSLYTDEIRQPLAPEDLADAIWRIAELPDSTAAGVWHLAGPERMSRWDMGLRLAEWSGLPGDVLLPATSPRDVPDPRPRDLTMLDDRSEAIGYAPRRVLRAGRFEEL